MKSLIKNTIFSLLSLSLLLFAGCSSSSNNAGALSNDIAERVYVAPGEYDEFYAFVSGGFSGQLAVYGLPSGRLFRVIPVCGSLALGIFK